MFKLLKFSTRFSKLGKCFYIYCLQLLPKFLDTSLSACHGLKTPADLHILAISDVLVLPSANFNPSASACQVILKLYQHFRVRNYPYGLQNTLSTLRPFTCSHYRTPQWTQDSIRVGS